MSEFAVLVAVSDDRWDHMDGWGGGWMWLWGIGLTEPVNTKLRLINRIAYGFRSTDNLIALCYLDRSGYCPQLPGRKPAA